MDPLSNLKRPEKAHKSKLSIDNQVIKNDNVFDFTSSSHSGFPRMLSDENLGAKASSATSLITKVHGRSISEDSGRCVSGPVSLLYSRSPVVTSFLTPSHMASSLAPSPVPQTHHSTNTRKLDRHISLLSDEEVQVIGVPSAKHLRESSTGKSSAVEAGSSPKTKSGKFSFFTSSSSAKTSTPALVLKTSNDASGPPIVTKIKDIFMTHYRPFSEVLDELSTGSSSGLNEKYKSLKLSKAEDKSYQLSGNAKTLHVLLNSLEESEKPTPKPSIDKKLSTTTNIPLFDFFAIIHLQDIKPVIKMRYPLDDIPNCPEDIIRNLPLFCFPEIGPTNRNSHDFSSETFTFVLNEANSNTKKYAYCKRILDKRKMPQVLCILSSTASSSIYTDILSIFESSMHKPEALFEIIREMWKHKCPRPGKSINISINQFTITLKRPMEATFLDERGIKKIFQCLGILGLKSLTQTNIHFLKLTTLFSALLMEKQVIFVSKSLQKLSDACNGAVSLMYPLEWQHIFIPILPTSLLDIVCSPTPYILGILASDMNYIVPGYNASFEHPSKAGKVVDGFDRDNCLIVNLDSGKLLYTDKLNSEKTLPTFLIAKLKQYLEEAFAKGREPPISDSLISFFLLLFGNYREYIEVEIKKLKPKGVNKHYEPVINKNEVVWVQRANSTVASPTEPHQKDVIPLKHSRSDELLSLTDEIRVWFDYDGFINNHPLVTGRLDSLKTREKHARILSLQQRQSIHDFLQALRMSHNFAFFIQQREEAFQFHYQMQLDKSKKGDEDDSNDVLENNQGLKQYYTLAQSIFEQRITQIEVIGTSIVFFIHLKMSYETTLLSVKEIQLFRVPPRQTSRGYRAQEWDVNQHLFTGKLKIVSQGNDKCFIRFEDPASGQLFAECHYTLDGSAVEQVVDSSRYFVVKVKDPSSGKHAFLGLGFPERNDAFDFNVALQDFIKHSKNEKEAVNKTTSAPGPKLDLGLKEGQTITINVPSLKKKESQQPQQNSGSFQQPPQASNAPSGWVQF